MLGSLASSLFGDSEAQEWGGFSSLVLTDAKVTMTALVAMVKIYHGNVFKTAGVCVRKTAY